MEKTEFYRWFAEQVQSRWPKWRINAAVLSDWFEAFGRYDAELLCRVISQHRIYDCPGQPNTRRLLEIIKSLQPAKPKVTDEPPQNCMPITYIQKNLDRLYSIEQRIEMMVNMSKFCSQPREKDPQAYDLAVQQGRIAAAAAKPNPQQLASAVAELMAKLKSNENNSTKVSSSGSRQDF